MKVRVEKEPASVAALSTFTLTFHSVKVASLVGLAPTRAGLKDRALGLLCIQRRFGKWGA